MKAITCVVCRRASSGHVSRTDSALSRRQEQARTGRIPLPPLPPPLPRALTSADLNLLPQHNHTGEFPVHSAVEDSAMTTHSRATQKGEKSNEISPDASFMTFPSAQRANPDPI